VTTVCSNHEQLTLTLANSVKTVDDSCLVNISSQGKCVSQTTPINLQSSVTQQSPITPSTQMNTVALFQCADQILTGLKKTRETDRVLAPVDLNVRGSSETGRDLFHTPSHPMRITRPSSDQPRRHLSSLHSDRLNSSADVLPSGVSLTTSGLTISEIVREIDTHNVCRTCTTQCMYVDSKNTCYVHNYECRLSKMASLAIYHLWIKEVRCYLAIYILSYK